ncbi:carbohydrate porin [Erythrobacter ani]|nr:carbohydrate porin [Erythrobacter ani]
MAVIASPHRGANQSCASRNFGRWSLLAAASLLYAAPALANGDASDGSAEHGLLAVPADSLLPAADFQIGPSLSLASAAAATASPDPSAPMLNVVAMPIGGPGAPPMTESFRAKLVVSQFVDIPVAGDAPDIVRYSGRADAYVDIGGSLFGLDDSFTLNIQPEFTWGEDSNGEIGVIPTNTALFRPGGKGDFDVSIHLRKQWNSGVSLQIGKINTLPIAGALPIVGSDGHSGFQNLGIALPPTAIIPNTMIGAHLTVPTNNGWVFRAWVFDPDSQFERTGFETAFEDGVAFLAAATKITRIGNNPGFYSIGLAGSTRSAPNEELLPLPLLPNGQFGDAEDELAVSLSAYQFLSVYPEAPGKGIGLLARFQLSDGDPTFLDWSGYFGIAGNPRFRPQDRFGVAYFRYSLTDELVDDVAFFLDLEDEQGVEVFYTLGFAKRFELTANAQVVNGAIGSDDTGVLLGMRLTSRF